MSDLHYDPLDPQIGIDPYPTYARLRRQAPLYRGESGFYALSRFEDVRWALSQSTDLSSSAMQDLVLAVGDGPPEGEEETTRTLIGTDPPEHTSIRKIVNRGFTRRRIEKLEGRIREIARELIDPIAEAGGGELVSDFCSVMPVMVIAEMLGVDSGKRRDFRRWSDDLVEVLGGQASEADVAKSKQSLSELEAYLGQILVDRRLEPRNDLISALIDSQAEEGVLRENELMFFTQLLLIAGNETTTYLIANAIDALLQHPDQMQMVIAKPDLIPNVIEETLRWNPPVQLSLRKATRDIETKHGTIENGALVVLLLASANRDEAIFPRADRFDVTRDPKGHLAFGFGTHFCLGSKLARMEAIIALEVLLEKMGDMRIVKGGHVSRQHTLLIRGANNLMVEKVSNIGRAEKIRRSA